MKVHRLGALGAEISGLGALNALGRTAIADLRTIWLEHLVVFIRDAGFDTGGFYDFACRFGEPMEYPFLKGLDGFPLITEVRKQAHEQVNFGGIWHTDMSYLPKPPMATMLIARSVPPYGGDTLFANLQLAYEALSAGMKMLLAPLTAISSSARAETTKSREDMIRTNAKENAPRELTTEHPVVRTHPETGRKGLYINPAHTTRFSGMTEEESAPLLNYLFRHQVKPEFTCRFSWSMGALALWDNRCTLHNPVNDYHGHERVMHRVTLKGDKPV
jgi:taurine dioxygenase